MSTDYFDTNIRVEHLIPPTLKLWICENRKDVQDMLTGLGETLPSDLTEACWMKNCNDSIYMLIQRDSSPGRLAHEAFHGTLFWMQRQGLDPNCHNVIRPGGNTTKDYGFIPAEIAANMVEQIVEFALLKMKEIKERQ